MTNNIVPEELIEAISRGDCVPFLGAGFSIHAGLPSTAQILSELAKRMGYKLTGNDPFEKITEIYANYKGDVELRKLIRKSLNTNEMRLSNGQITFGKLIRNGYFQTIVTTNYDNIVEMCIEQSSKKLAQFRTLTTDSPIPFIENSEVKILKYHGSIDRESTMVVTESDYFRAMAERKKLYILLRTIFQTKNLIFIGFSMQDLDFRLLFNDLRYETNKLSRRGFFVNSRAQNPNWEIEKSYYWSKKNIEIIELDVDEFFSQIDGRLN